MLTSSANYVLMIVLKDNHSLNFPLARLIEVLIVSLLPQHIVQFGLRVQLIVQKNVGRLFFNQIASINIASFNIDSITKVIEICCHAGQLLTICSYNMTLFFVGKMVSFM